MSNELSTTYCRIQGNVLSGVISSAWSNDIKSDGSSSDFCANSGKKFMLIIVALIDNKVFE